MIVMNHPTAKRDGWGKNSNVKPKDNNALESITVEVVSSQTADDIIDVDISDQEQITD